MQYEDYQSLLLKQVFNNLLGIFTKKNPNVSRRDNVSAETAEDILAESESFENSWGEGDSVEGDVPSD